MLEMEVIKPGEARLLSEGKAVGTARWKIKALTWPGERVKVALVDGLSAPADCRGDFWAYLTFLFQRDGAAAAKLDGAWFWFSQALEKSWQAAGSPEAYSEI